VLLLAVVRPAINTPAVAILTLIPAFLLFGAFEWSREAARRPFVINQVMYSNGVSLARAEGFREEGFLAQTRFAAVREAKDDNLAAAGAELFKFQCYACHTIGGINNDILPRTAAMDFPTMTKYLRNVIHKRPYMPPFLGTEQEARALAAYIVGDLHGKPVDLTPAAPAEAGRQVYDNHCIGCHDLDIVTAWAKGKPLEEISAGLASLSQINAMMADFAGSAAEQQLLAAFLQGAPAPPAAAGPGEAVYADHCIGCHGIDIIVNWTQGKSVEEITAGLASLNSLNPGMPDFSGTDEERQQLAGFLYGCRVPAASAGSNGKEVYASNCIGCHGAEVIMNWAVGKNEAAISAGLADLGRLNPMMAGLSLEETDRAALAAWIHVECQGGAK
jgi:mono/diheme cytochrome c family protein